MVRHRSAKPFTAVRFCQEPLKKAHYKWAFLFLNQSQKRQANRFISTYPFGVNDIPSRDNSSFCSIQSGTSRPWQLTTRWQGIFRFLGTSFNARPTKRACWGYPIRNSDTFISYHCSWWNLTNYVIYLFVKIVGNTRHKRGYKSLYKGISGKNV